MTLITQGFEEHVFEKGKDRYDRMRAMLRSAHLVFAPREEFYPTHGLTVLKEDLSATTYEPTPASDVPRRRVAAEKSAGERAELDGAAHAMLER